MIRDMEDIKKYKSVSRYVNTNIWEGWKMVVEEENPTVILFPKYN